MKKDIQNEDTVTHKLRPASIRVINHRLEVIRKDKRKREEMVEKQKAEAIAAKRWKNRGESSVSSEEKDNYDSDTIDDIDLNQAKSKYRVPRLDRIEVTSNEGVKLKAAIPFQIECLFVNVVIAVSHYIYTRI